MPMENRRQSIAICSGRAEEPGFKEARRASRLQRHPAAVPTFSRASPRDPATPRGKPLRSL